LLSHLLIILHNPKNLVTCKHKHTFSGLCNYMWWILWDTRHDFLSTWLPAHQAYSNSLVISEYKISLYIAPAWFLFLRWYIHNARHCLLWKENHRNLVILTHSLKRTSSNLESDHDYAPRLSSCYLIYEDFIRFFGWFVSTVSCPWR
jgi:hypothetical protein